MDLFLAGLLTEDEGAISSSPPPKVCYTCPTMIGAIIPGLEKAQKIYKSRDASLEFC